MSAQREQEGDSDITTIAGIAVNTYALQNLISKSSPDYLIPSVAFTRNNT